MTEPSYWRFNKQVHSSYVLDLDIDKNQVLVEYVYISEEGDHVHSKCRKLNMIPNSHEDVPDWTYAANFPVEDRFLKPVAMYTDPFRRGNHKLVMCEVYANDWTPAPRNFRSSCAASMATGKVLEAEPWFGIEQEYSIVDVSNRPIGWTHHLSVPVQTGVHHDAVGMHRAFGRDLYEAHLFACLYAGVNLSGGNAEAFPGQWEFQVGPSKGVKACDELWISRYILHRLSEEFGYAVTFTPKPVKGKTGACGGHVNFSTKQMRHDGGIEHIVSAMACLGHTHSQYLPLCDAHGGEDNRDRLLGFFCTASKDFRWGIEDRDACIRIPRQVAEEGKGFLEDRRPASNLDPYLVTDALVKVIILGEEQLRNPYSEPRVRKLAQPELKE